MRYLLLSLVLAACGGDDGNSQMDAPGGGTTPLTVKNYLNWCSVSVNGGSSSTAAMQSVTVNAGAITLKAKAAAGFILGTDMWHHTDGDTGAGEAGTVAGDTSTATVTVSTTAKCVWVCCPFPDGSGCNVADQC